MSTKIINQNLRNVVQICYEMLEIADRGDSFRNDSECGAVYGCLRDAAYKIRQLADHELLRHENATAAAKKIRKKSNNVHKPNNQKGKKDE
jgi:hypothetical protein